MNMWWAVLCMLLLLLSSVSPCRSQSAECRRPMQVPAKDVSPFWRDTVMSAFLSPLDNSISVKSTAAVNLERVATLSWTGPHAPSVPTAEMCASTAAVVAAVSTTSLTESQHNNDDGFAWSWMIPRMPLQPLSPEVGVDGMVYALCAILTGEEWDCEEDSSASSSSSSCSSGSGNAPASPTLTYAHIASFDLTEVSVLRGLSGCGVTTSHKEPSASADSFSNDADLLQFSIDEIALHLIRQGINENRTGGLGGNVTVGVQLTHVALDSASDWNGGSWSLSWPPTAAAAAGYCHCAVRRGDPTSHRVLVLGCCDTQSMLLELMSSMRGEAGATLDVIWHPIADADVVLSSSFAMARVTVVVDHPLAAVVHPHKSSFASQVHLFAPRGFTPMNVAVGPMMNHTNHTDNESLWAELRAVDFIPQLLDLRRVEGRDVDMRHDDTKLSASWWTGDWGNAVRELHAAQAANLGSLPHISIVIAAGNACSGGHLCVTVPVTIVEWPPSPDEYSLPLLVASYQAPPLMYAVPQCNPGEAMTLEFLDAYRLEVIDANETARMTNLFGVYWRHSGVSVPSSASNSWCQTAGGGVVLNSSTNVPTNHPNQSATVVLSEDNTLPWHDHRDVASGCDKVPLAPMTAEVGIVAWCARQGGDEPQHVALTPVFALSSAPVLRPLLTGVSWDIPTGDLRDDFRVAGRVFATRLQGPNRSLIAKSRRCRSVWSSKRPKGSFVLADSNRFTSSVRAVAVNHEWGGGNTVVVNRSRLIFRFDRSSLEEVSLGRSGGGGGSGHWIICVTALPIRPPKVTLNACQWCEALAAGDVAFPMPPRDDNDRSFVRLAPCECTAHGMKARVSVVSRTLSPPLAVAVAAGVLHFSSELTLVAVALPSPDPPTRGMLSERWWAALRLHKLSSTNTANERLLSTALRRVGLRPLHLIPLPWSYTSRVLTLRKKPHLLCTTESSKGARRRLVGLSLSALESELTVQSAALLYPQAAFQSPSWWIRVRGAVYGAFAMCAVSEDIPHDMTRGEDDVLREPVGQLTIPGPSYTIPMSQVASSPQLLRSLDSAQEFTVDVSRTIVLSFAVMEQSAADYLRSGFQLVRVEDDGASWGPILGVAPPKASHLVQPRDGRSTEILPSPVDIASPLMYEEVSWPSLGSDFIERVVSCSIRVHVPGLYAVAFAAGFTWDETKNTAAIIRRQEKPLMEAMRTAAHRIPPDSPKPAFSSPPADLLRHSQEQLWNSAGLALILGVNQTRPKEREPNQRWAPPPSLQDLSRVTFLNVIAPPVTRPSSVEMRISGDVLTIKLSRLPQHLRRATVWAVGCPISVANSDGSASRDSLADYPGANRVRHSYRRSRTEEGTVLLLRAYIPSALPSWRGNAHGWCGQSRLSILAGWHRLARGLLKRRPTIFEEQAVMKNRSTDADLFDTVRVIWRPAFPSIAASQDVIMALLQTNEHATNANTYPRPAHSESSEAATELSEGVE